MDQTTNLSNLPRTSCNPKVTNQLTPPAHFDTGVQIYSALNVSFKATMVDQLMQPITEGFFQSWCTLYYTNHTNSKIIFAVFILNGSANYRRIAYLNLPIFISKLYQH